MNVNRESIMNNTNGPNFKIEHRKYYKQVIIGKDMYVKQGSKSKR